MRLELTEITEKAYQSISAAGSDILSAVDYLRSGIQIRQFISVLVHMYPHSDLKERLISGFSEAYPDAEHASTVRKIQNWINKKNVPSKREDIYILCFALGLSEEDTSYLLGFVSDYGIHYRSPRELTYAYCLRSGKTYTDAVRFYESLENRTDKKAIPLEFQKPPHTSAVYQHFRNITDDEEFREEYAGYRSWLGIFHLKAYETFCVYYRQLARPYSDDSADFNDSNASTIPSIMNEEIKKLSVEDIVEQYLLLGMPSAKKRSHLTSLQKLLKDGWPNATLLFNILNQKANVSRKLLILLYIVTQNLVDIQYDEPDGECLTLQQKLDQDRWILNTKLGEVDEDYLTPQERLDEHRWTLDTILDQCGMNPLDPRNAYDWLALYSMYTDSEEDMDERMREIIHHLFPEEQSRA